MISYLRGILIKKTLKEIIIDVNGVGYRVLMPASYIPKLSSISEEIEIFTYLNVSQEAISLFGFITYEQYELFKMIISVSSIGSKTALNILSDMKVLEFHRTILSKDTKNLCSISGIGKKTAERIILELKDKVAKISLGSTSDDIIKLEQNISAVNSSTKEAFDALLSLGYKNAEIYSSFSKIKDIEILKVEEIIQKALKTFI